MNEKIEAIKKYLEFFPNSYEAENNLKLLQYAEELGIPLNGGYYPKMDGGVFTINDQMRAGKNWRLKNSSTEFKTNGTDTVVVWTESCGRLAFVKDEYWSDIEEEWEWFQSVLLSYKPLDRDAINNTFLYNVENGKMLIADYPKIKSELSEKIKIKIRKVELQKKKKEIERLEKELEESNKQ